MLGEGISSGQRPCSDKTGHALHVLLSTLPPLGRPTGQHIHYSRAHILSPSVLSCSKISVRDFLGENQQNCSRILDLTLDFAPPSAGGKLSRVHYDRPVKLSPVEIRTLIERFSARYGAYDRILRRRKMEPAGRIVGFEWQRVDGATFRVVLRHEFVRGSDSMRLNVVARSTTSEPRAKGQACGNS